MDFQTAWAGWIGEQPAEAEQATIETLITQAEQTATSKWPRVQLSRESFFAFVAARIGQLAAPAEELRRRHLVDLWLSCAALTGAPGAVSTFDREVGPAMQRAARRVCGDDAAADDVCQTIRQRLLLPRRDGPGALSTYSGKSALSSWITVVTLRQAGRSAKKGEEPDESDLFVAAEAGANPELVAMKREHAESFKAAFKAAMANLSPRDRASLRFHLVEGLTIDEIASLESIHRATAARRIAAARTKIHDDVRARLRAELGLTRAELESLIRVVRSQLDFSVRRHLKSQALPEPTEA